MKSFTAGLALCALFASTCPAEINWTYHPRIHGPEGPESAYVTATVAGREIRYVPPVKWTVSGGLFIPPGKLQADCFVNAATIKAPAPWTADRAKAIHEAALAQLIPKGATNEAIISEGVIPIQIDGQSAYEICMSYAYYGQTYMKAVVFVEHLTMQLQFHFGSLKNDFADLHGAFLGSLSSVDGF